jgi:cytoskeletal protein RodZ
MLCKNQECSVPSHQKKRKEKWMPSTMICLYVQISMIGDSALTGGGGG